jgi:hypothetical protein
VRCSIAAVLKAQISWIRRARIWILAAFTYAFFFSGGDPNQATRYSLVESLVDRRAPDITPVHFRTIDKGYKRQRFYADKAPGLSLLATVPYAVMRVADVAFGIDPGGREAQLSKLYVLSLIFAGLAGAVSAAMLRRLGLLLGCSERASELVAFAYAFGTIAFPFSTVLFGHQLAAALLLTSFVLLLESRERGRLARPRVLAALGALWSLAIVVEYPTALLVAIFGVSALVLGYDEKNPARSLLTTLSWAALGGAPVLVVHALFLIWCYGKFALPYVYVSEPFFRAHMTGGILGIGLPQRVATYGSLVSPYRGLLFYCPVVALFVVGVGAWIDSRRAPVALFILAPAFAIYLLFLCAYYAWDGGGSTGPRHILPALPFFLLPIAFFADRGRASFAVTMALTVASSVIMLASTAVLVQQPQGDVFAMNPLYDLVFPALANGTVGVNSQDAFVPFPRADSCFNWGTLLGLPPGATPVVVGLAWAVSYAPSALGLLRRREYA